MGLVTKPFHLEAGNTARASELNDNFDAIIAQVNGNIQEVNLANGSVTENKIGDGAVTTAKIGDLQVTTAKLGDLQVTTGKIGDLQVTDAKVAAGVNAAKIGTGTVSNTEFGRLDGVTSGIQSQLDAKLPLGGGTLDGRLTIRSDSTSTGAGALRVERSDDPDQAVQLFRGTSPESFLRNIAADAVAGTLRIDGDGVGFRPGSVSGTFRDIWHDGNTDGRVTTAKIEGAAVTAAKLATGANERNWVADRTAAVAAGAVGSLAFASLSPNVVGDILYGGTTGGASLVPASADGTVGNNTSLTGTWRCLGRGNTTSPTLWLRIS